MLPMRVDDGLVGDASLAGQGWCDRMVSFWDAPVLPGTPALRLWFNPQPDSNSSDIRQGHSETDCFPLDCERRRTKGDTSRNRDSPVFQGQLDEDDTGSFPSDSR